jgi:alkylation response protein AidB-like acyl-CoA dehydrogenase
VNFDFSESQRLLRETVSRWAADAVRGDTHRLKTLRAAPGGVDRAAWTALGDLGVLALPFAEAEGGLGGGPVDLLALAEPIGRALVPLPVTECLVAAGTLFAEAAPPALRARHLPAIMSGALLLSAAITEQRGRTNLAHVETRARGGADGWTLSGAKSAVWQGGAADAFLVTARKSGAARDRGGIALYLVPRDAPGLEVRPWRTADGSVAAELTLRDVALAPDARLADGLGAVETALTGAWLAASAEMLGLAELLLETTLAYVKGREQFGRPIGSFQVIQHRLTDCYVAVEQARSMVYRAALASDADRARSVAGCHGFVSEAARQVAHEAVQFHGGMGVTDELLVGHALKRIQLLSRLWTDPESAMLAWAEAA